MIEEFGIVLSVISCRLLSISMPPDTSPPGGILNAFAWPLAVYRKQRVFIVYRVDYQGI